MEMIYYDDEDIVDRIMQILGIKQGDKESVEEFTKRYDSRVMLWNSELPEEEKRIWYTLGLKRQYLYEVKSLLPETYDQAKQLALINVENDDKSVDQDIGRERCIDYRYEDQIGAVSGKRSDDADSYGMLIEKMFAVYKLVDICQCSVDRNAKVVMEGNLNISVVYEKYVMIV
ncbi:17688_t:CDS:2, partial [Racocetra persica]